MAAAVEETRSGWDRQFLVAHFIFSPLFVRTLRHPQRKRKPGIGVDVWFPFLWSSVIVNYKQSVTCCLAIIWAKQPPKRDKWLTKRKQHTTVYCSKMVQTGELPFRWTVLSNEHLPTVFQWKGIGSSSIPRVVSSVLWFIQIPLWNSSNPNRALACTLT